MNDRPADTSENTELPVSRTGFLNIGIIRCATQIAAATSATRGTLNTMGAMYARIRRASGSKEFISGGEISVDSEEIKALVKKLGADLCGIATEKRFLDAPKEFRPTDIYSKCKSLIVFAKKMPSEPLFAENCVPYTHINTIITQEVDKLGMYIALELEKAGIKAVPIPSDDPYEHWEPERSYGRAILSMRHSGYLAGLGVLGKNTLLINKDYGNMIQIGVVLVNIELEEDPLANYEGCLSNCNLCIDSCPQKALNGKTVNQKLCRPISNYRNEKGYYLKKCSLCRMVCPNALGIKHL